MTADGERRRAVHAPRRPDDVVGDGPTARGECENVYDENEMGACDNGFECSVCGCRVEDEEHYRVSGTWNFCPQCGRKAVSHAR